MDTNKILVDLRAERDRIDHAISAIEGLQSTGDHAGRQARSSASALPTSAPRTGRRRISAEGRKRIAEAARKMWAKRRKKAAPAKSAPAKKASPARHMSAATRKRLSELAKQRWAKRKKEKAA